MTVENQRRDTLYAEASQALAPAIRRMARAVEADADLARDLEQDVHLALWRSFERFDGRCALATWTYRVAHNVAADHVAKHHRRREEVTLDAVVALPDGDDPAATVDAERTLARIRALIAQLKSPDRSVILLYLEGQDTATIAAVTGLSASNVAVKVHRVKALLSRRFQEAA